MVTIMVILYRSANRIPLSVRPTLYYTLIYPYLTYCNLIWPSTYKSNLNRIVIIQKRAVRYIVNIPYGAHTGIYFQQLGLLNVDQIRRAQIGEFMFRHVHGLLPSIFKNFFSPSTVRHPYQTRHVTPYVPPFAHTNTRLFAIRCTGPRLWNLLPPNIRSQPNVILFKNKLRLFLKDHVDQS